MAAVIRIEIQTSGGLEDVKKDLQDVSKTAEQSGSGFSALKEIGVGALRELGAAAINLAGTALSALGGAIQDGIADAQENAKIQAQTAAVIKSTGEAAGVTAQHVADYASSLSDAAGQSLFGDDQIQQSTNLLLTFGEIKGATLDAATAISVDMAQALGGAPKDAAIQLGKALNDPVKGITALTRVGVTFSDEQKAQIQAMQEAGDTAGAQAVILAELNKEFGGSAAAAAAATGGWSEFNGRMGEAKEALGAAVLPLLSTLAGILLDTVVPVIEEAAAALGPLIQYFQAVVEDGDTMNDFLSSLPEGMQPFIQMIGDAVVVVQNFASALIENFQGAQGATQSFIGDLGYFLDTITGVGEDVRGPFQAAFESVSTVIQTQIMPAFNAVWTVLQTQVMPILNDLATALFPLVGAAIQILAGFWTDVLVPAVKMLWSILTTVVLPVIAALAGWLADNLPTAIKTVADFLTGTFFPALNKVYTFIQTNVIPILQTVAQWLITNVPVAIQRAADFWNNILWPALNKAWLFIQDNVIPIINKLINEVFADLDVAVRAVADLWSGTLEPALYTVWSFIDTYINPILRTLANVVIAAVKLEVSALATLWNTTLLPAITAVYNFINDKIVPIFIDLKDKYIGGLKTALEGISTVWTNTLKPALESLQTLALNGLYTALASLNDNVLSPMKGFFEGIGTAVSDLITWINSLIKKIAEVVIPDWLEGNSPPPMADWFSYIADSVKAVNAELPALQMNLATATGPGGGGSSYSSSNSRSFTYAPQITTSGNVSAPMDLALATSLAGV